MAVTGEAVITVKLDDQVSAKIDKLISLLEGGDVSDSLRPSPETEAAQQASAEELAPPTRPDAVAPSGEPQPDPVVPAAAEGLSPAFNPEPEPAAAEEPAPVDPALAPDLEPQAPGDQPVVAPVPDVDNDPALPNPTVPAPTEQPVSPGEQTPAAPNQGGEL